MIKGMFFWQAKLTEQREHTKQVAAFNLQMSKRKKTSCSALQVSKYVNDVKR